MAISDTILSIIEGTPSAIIQGIASRVKQRRLEKGLTQSELSLRAGVPLPTYRRFERKSEISLRALVMLAMALGMTEEFSALFATPTYRNIDEMLQQQKKRQRGRRNGKN